VFANASTFNQDISSWDVSGVNSTSMNQPFVGASSFDQDISGWNVLNIPSKPGGSNWDNGTPGTWTTAEKPQWGTDGIGIFYPLTGETSDPTNTTWRSTYAPASYVYDTTPGAEGIRVSTNDPITSMRVMFKDNTTFNNADVSSWDVSTVTNMLYMFDGAEAFNQPLSSWDVSNVTRMDSMFRIYSGTSTFNQDISSWDTSSVTNMDAMFQNASVFDQDISGWNVSLIASKPGSFDTGTPGTWTTAEKPVWGTDGT